MKTHTNTLLLIALIGLIAYHSFFNGGALQQARQLTQTLHIQIDTLQRITDRYEQIHQDYLTVHQQLLSSQARASSISAELGRLSTSQQTDVREIQLALQTLLVRYDTMDFAAPNTDSLDSLFFQP